MPIKAVTFDAYGTLLRNKDLKLIPRRIVADHGLSVQVFEATQRLPFRTLRELEGEVLGRVLRQFGIGADVAPISICSFRQGHQRRPRDRQDGRRASRSLPPVPRALRASRVPGPGGG